MRLLARLHRIDRRWLYLATLVLMLVPFVTPLTLPAGHVSRTTRAAFELIDSCPPDKVVIIDSSWDAGSQAENRAQLEAVVAHLCRRRIKFVVTSLGVTALGPDFARDIIRPLAERAGYEYGRDWVQLGFVQGVAGALGPVIDRFCRDLWGLYPRDVHNTPVEELPLMQAVRRGADAHAFCCFTYAPVYEWISFAHAQYGLRLVFGCMTIMCPAYYPYIDSGQLAGMLVGNVGAAEYEALNGVAGRGTRLGVPAAFGNCAIIIAAVLGNIGLWAERRGRRAAA